MRINSPTDNLIKKFVEQGHSLATPVTRDEVPTLIEALRNRLGVSVTELDLSCKSLKKLEELLVSLYESTQTQGTLFAEEDILHLLREMTAYIGEVLIKETRGRWGNSASSLWYTEVIAEGPWEVIEDHHRYDSPYPSHFIVGSDASNAWDVIISGKRPNLHRVCYEAKKRKAVERLLKQK